MAVKVLKQLWTVVLNRRGIKWRMQVGGETEWECLRTHESGTDSKRETREVSREKKGVNVCAFALVREDLAQWGP